MSTLTSILRNNLRLCVFKKSMPAFKQTEQNGIDKNVNCYDPCGDLYRNSLKDQNYGVLILNSPTPLQNNDLWEIWNNAKIRVFVDGGAESYVVKWVGNSTGPLKPHLITGDFDSVSKSTLQMFRQSDDVEVVHTPDQDHTDFTKAIIELDKYRSEKGIELQNVFATTEFTEGRIDHIMANINTLFLAQKRFPHLRVYRLCTNSISWLLKPGKHSICIPEILRQEREWCSLVPIGAPAVISTSGLRWNLDNHKCFFGEMVSTSNTYDGAPQVEIQNDSPILWSMSTVGLKL